VNRGGCARTHGTKTGGKHNIINKELPTERTKKRRVQNAPQSGREGQEKKGKRGVEGRERPARGQTGSARPVKTNPMSDLTGRGGEGKQKFSKRNRGRYPTKNQEGG